MNTQQAINQLKQMHNDGFELSLENEDYDALIIAIDALTFQAKLAPVVHTLMQARDENEERTASRALAKLYSEDLDRTLTTTGENP